MENPTRIKERLDNYYKALSEKGDFGPLLSENFLLTGTVAKETKGREAYTNNMFFKMVKSLEVKTMVAEGEGACAIVNYELEHPKAGTFACDVAEIWKMKNGKLCSVEIYFDTAAFQKFMLPILFPLKRLKKKI